MRVNISEANGKKYLEGIPGFTLVRDENDAVDIMSAGAHERIDRLLLYAENLTEDFYDLKTRVAGNILQKFMNYRIRIAAVIPAEYLKGRFGEMVSEANSGNDFRVFQDKDKALDWLSMD
ncbi:MAG: DUF4180 domain-containing protein [Spirochaetales bacterium]|nr:DUF4180 domain-containing protein [Spirochaetales bacterium]